MACTPPQAVQHDREGPLPPQSSPVGNAGLARTERPDFKPDGGRAVRRAVRAAPSSSRASSAGPPRAPPGRGQHPRYRHAEQAQTFVGRVRFRRRQRRRRHRVMFHPSFLRQLEHPRHRPVGRMPPDRPSRRALLIWQDHASKPSPFALWSASTSTTHADGASRTVNGPARCRRAPPRHQRPDAPSPAPPAPTATASPTAAPRSPARPRLAPASAWRPPPPPCAGTRVRRSAPAPRHPRATAPAGSSASPPTLESLPVTTNA